MFTFNVTLTQFGTFRITHVLPDGSAQSTSVDTEAEAQEYIQAHTAKAIRNLFKANPDLAKMSAENGNVQLTSGIWGK